MSTDLSSKSPTSSPSHSGGPKKGSIASITNPAAGAAPTDSSTTSTTEPQQPLPLPSPPEMHNNNNNNQSQPVEAMYSYSFSLEHAMPPQGQPTIPPQLSPYPGSMPPPPGTYVYPGPPPPPSSLSSHNPMHNTIVAQGGAGRGGRRTSPDQLMPLDAPTQPRTYLTPSSTSKKDPPLPPSPPSLASSSQGNNKRPRSPNDDGFDDQDELADEQPPAANATDKEKIEWKRRQNTLAARRSRKRKMMYTQQLETTVEKLTMEKEVWKTRTMTLKHLLHSHGIPCPDFKD